jgi:hypothetical protein
MSTPSSPIAAESAVGDMSVNTRPGLALPMFRIAWDRLPILLAPGLGADSP